MLVDISLQKQDQSQNLMPVLGDFHTAECMQHSIGKYIRGSALEESLRQARVFELNIADSVLDGMHKGLLNLQMQAKNRIGLYSLKQLKVTA